MLHNGTEGLRISFRSRGQKIVQPYLYCTCMHAIMAWTEKISTLSFIFYDRSSVP